MEPYIGEIRPFSFGSIPNGWLACDGAVLRIIEPYKALFALLGNRYGGDGVTTFGLPDLRGRVPVGASTTRDYSLAAVGGAADVTLAIDQLPSHDHALQVSMGLGNSASVRGTLYAAVPDQLGKLYAPFGDKPFPIDSDMLAPAGGGGPHSNMQPYLAISFCIAFTGDYPSPDRGEAGAVEARDVSGGGHRPGTAAVIGFAGEIRLFARGYAPQGWLSCDGRLLDTARYAQLFALIGYTYGSAPDTTSFRIPDLAARVALGHGRQGLNDYPLGAAEGSPSIVLGSSGMPRHGHPFNVTHQPATSSFPDPDVGFGDVEDGYSFYIDTAKPTSGSLDFSSLAVKSSGGDVPHPNMMPFLCLKAILCPNGLSPDAPPEAEDAAPRQPRPRDPVDDQYIGEIRLFATSFLPYGWLPCNGNEFAVNSYQALFALIGYIFGGREGAFCTPMLNGRVALSEGRLVDSAEVFRVGDRGGTESVVLTEVQMPAHTHQMRRKSPVAPTSKTANPTEASDIGVLALAATNLALPMMRSGGFPDSALDPATIGFAGGSPSGTKPHENRQPYLALTYGIAFQGQWPSQP
ncbi:phage tail protein [Prosthecomicrobium pneumaticum]|uniref:Microcystin-dependent protein n=1 Tax=Prosthecomicrobium pneumaticum TaxID=81895 RepID=A0A7W9L2W4_9HYPH|nr:tail fiber protein [Prosthecomicrobium pneumaticum]MBB5753922.1 microcystin-dependent protein [Prosthecomicrobium pneumaticum]